jgi:hypothetical protein
MSCNCIEEFNKLIREKSGDTEGRVKMSYSLNRETGKMSSLPSMYCEYRDKKKDGTFSKPHTHPIGGEYCPFCVKAYDTASDQPKDGDGEA